MVYRIDIFKNCMHDKFWKWFNWVAFVWMLCSHFAVRGRELLHTNDCAAEVYLSVCRLSKSHSGFKGGLNIAYIFPFSLLTCICVPLFSLCDFFFRLLIPILASVPWRKYEQSNSELFKTWNCDRLNFLCMIWNLCHSVSVSSIIALYYSCLWTLES